MIGDGAVAVRILVAAGLGAAIGLERELRDQPAGLRTHMLVALGSCLFTLVSAYGFNAFTTQPATLAVRADVTRVASQIVVGIGFLGGGAILRHGGTIRGLTTAATLWVVAAIGLAAGVGFYSSALIVTAVAIIALEGLKPLERLLDRKIKEEEPAEPREP
jgi:putative Mg2+ transporter-C (MgtC) family protein